MKYNSYIFKAFMLLAGAGVVTTSCEDMLDTESKFFISGDHLTTPADTANSLVGIIYQLQAIAERTHLLGEVRGDLVTVKSTADQDLIQMANFDMSDENKYNNPRDYYAVINNCNYYLAKADLGAVNTQAERIFWREYVQVKAIRAWTYLQLALNYGSVQFYTEPILTEPDAAKEYPRKNLQEICDFFIQDLTLDPTYSTTEYPSLYSVGNLLLANCFFPVDVVLGDLYLWRASLTGSQSDYRNAATRYASWIFRNGSVGAYNKTRYNLGQNYVWWPNDGTYSLHTNPSMVESGNFVFNDSYSSLFYNNRGAVGEAVTMIPMDSLAYQGYYNNMRYLYTNIDDETMSLRTEDFYITPSEHLQELSAAQHYSYWYRNEGEANARSFDVPVSTKYPLLNGDMRLFRVWTTRTHEGGVMDESRTAQQINKPCTGRDIWIYRRTDLFLRLAEALNNGGFPRLGHMILANGIGFTTARDSALVYMNDEEKSFFNNVLNSNNEFNYYLTRDGLNEQDASTYSFISVGIHSRGCGYAEWDPTYVYPMIPGEGNADYEAMEQELFDNLTARVTDNWDEFVDESLKEAFGFTEDAEGSVVNGGFKAAFKSGITQPEAEEIIDRMWNNNVTVTYNAQTVTFAKQKDALLKWWANYGDNKEQEQRLVDQMILDEMALETCMEGKRFYDLMRFAKRYSDPTIVATPVSQRAGAAAQDGALYSRLLNEQNWFMKWQGKMGY